MIRDEDVPSGTLPPLAQNSPHSEEYGSVEDELVERVLHHQPLFKDDNAKLCYYLLIMQLRSNPTKGKGMEGMIGYI